MEKAVRLMGNIMVSGGQERIFCLDGMFFHRNRRLCTARRKTKNVKRELEKERQKASKRFDVKDQTLLYIKRLWVYNRECPPRDLLHAPISETKIHFWRKKAMYIESYASDR